MNSFAEWRPGLQLGSANEREHKVVDFFFFIRAPFLQLQGQNRGEALEKMTG